MADIHLTRELLWAVSRGELPPSVVTQIGMQHLMSLCPACRKEINAFQKERRAGAANSQALQMLPVLLEEQIPRIEKEQRGAARDLADLLVLPREERVQRVERARNRFRSAALIRLLIGESRKRVQEDPEEAFHLASLARRVAHCNPQMPHSFDLIALATAHMANACRAGNDRRQAEDHPERLHDARRGRPLLRGDGGRDRKGSAGLKPHLLSSSPISLPPPAGRGGTPAGHLACDGQHRLKAFPSPGRGEGDGRGDRGEVSGRGRAGILPA